MGRFVLEKPAPVRRTMGQNDEDSIIIIFLNLRVRYNKLFYPRARACVRAFVCDISVSTVLVYRRLLHVGN